MKPGRYQKLRAGQWTQPIKRRYKQVCCDCCLVHWIDFRIVRGRVQYRAYRANGLTAALRKREKLRVRRIA